MEAIVGAVLVRAVHTSESSSGKRVLVRAVLARALVRTLVRVEVRAVQVRAAAAAAGAEQGPGNRTVALAPWTLS